MRAIWQYLQTPPLAVDSWYTAPPAAVEIDKWFTPPSQPLARVRRSVQVQRVILPDFGAATYLRYYVDARGLYRVFNAAEYRFYWGATPPAEGDTPDDTAASLPHTPSETFADGTWYLSVSYFNGVLDSGFIPVGPNGETYLTVTIASGAAVTSPPLGPQEWHLEQRAGVVRVVGLLWASGDTQPDEWSIGYTTNGTTPTEDVTTASTTLAQDSLAIISYDLPAQANGTTVKVRLQTRRNDGTEASPAWVYSDGSTVKTITVDATGPTTPLAGDTWAGSLPEE